MRRWTQWSLALLILSGAWAQDPSLQDTLDWAESLTGQFQAIRNPVIGSHAMGQLAAIICPIDARRGSTLYRQALQRAGNLPDSVFADMDGPLLPAYSFGALWKSLMPAATRCDPALSGVVSNAEIQRRLDSDKQQAGSRLVRALELVADDPARAARLARDTALSGIDSGSIDMAVMQQVLSQLRTRSPDVAQDLYRGVLDSIASANEPNPTQLMHLGKYLFVPTQFWLLPDDDVSSQVVALIGTRPIVVADFTRIRQTANTAEVNAYMSAALKSIKTVGPSDPNAVAAFAIADQMLDKAAVLSPDLVPQLKSGMARIPATDLLSDGGFLKGFLQNQRAVAPPADSARTTGSRNQYQAVGRVLEAIQKWRVEDARQLLSRIDEAATRTQLSALIDFTSGTLAIERNDLQRAFAIANSLQPGIKRALLYAGIVAAGDRDLVEQAYTLAARDAQAGPPEQSVAILAALAGAKMGTDPDTAVTILGQVVAALNGLRRSTDWSPSELIADGSKTYYTPIRVPGVSALTLPQALAKTKNVDFRRLESVVLQLRDESRMAAALNAIAASRAIPKR